MNKCNRCGKDFEISVPPVTNPKGVREIAGKEFCVSCNQRMMGALFRQASAYFIPGQRPQWQHEPVEVKAQSIAEPKIEAKAVESSDERKIKAFTGQQGVAAGVCPDCHTTLYFQEGCYICYSCGYGKC